MQEIKQYSDFRFAGIYTIKNTTNNKLYVGSSDDICYRLYRHNVDLNAKKHHSIHLQRAWDKYGCEAFQYICLESCGVELLIEREQHWIDHFCSSDRAKGYNISPTAGSCRGLKLSAEHKSKISKAHLGKKLSEETKRKISQIHKENPYWKGKHHSEESKKKIVTAKTGLTQSTETKEKKNNSIRKGGSRGGTSQYKGVSWDARRQKWQSQKRLNGKIIYIGSFDDEIDAAHNYDYHSNKLDAGSYLNFPTNDYSSFVPQRELAT